MDKQLITLFTVLLLLFLLPWGRLPPLAQMDQNEFTSDFRIRDCSFQNQGTNAFFDISPGRQMRYSNVECFEAGVCDSLVETTLSVLNQTRNIPLQIEDRGIPVDARVILTQRTVNGMVVETRSEFYAECSGTGDVYHLGKSVQAIRDDGTASAEGSWLAGVDGAQPGLAFPGGVFLLGSRYFRELAPGVALDRAQHVASGLEVTVPFGTFTDCVEVRETDNLDPAQRSVKIYCPGVGLVKQDEVELVLATGGTLIDSEGTIPDNRR